MKIRRQLPKQASITNAPSAVRDVAADLRHGDCTAARFVIDVCHRYIGVRVHPDPRDDANGRAWALWVPALLSIYVAADCPPSERCETVVHELAHAFDFFFGATRDDDESRASRAAAIAMTWQRALVENGGEQSVHAIFAPVDARPVIRGV